MERFRERESKQGFIDGRADPVSYRYFKYQNKQRDESEGGLYKLREKGWNQVFKRALRLSSQEITTEIRFSRR